MLLTIIFFIILFYLVLIGWLNQGFNKVENFELQDLPNKTKFSIIIPFRNEAKNLTQLLASIKRLNYKTALFEVLLVNDDSDDGSEKIINTFCQKNLNSHNCQITLINNKRTSNSPKKDAITSALKIAQHDWIITTDADCILPKYWLDAFDEFIQLNNTIAIAAPVKFIGASSFFNRFQILDTLSLQGVTIGAFGIHRPFMCNGANFGYSKNAFESVDGFKGNDEFASGDDVFLFQKFLKYDKNRVHFLKSEKAIVTTKVSETISEFIQQRIRWASKSSKYKIVFPKFLGLIVLVTNLVLVGLIPLYIFKVFNLKTAILIFLIKFSIDLLIIFKSSRFFKQEAVLLSYAFVSLIHPFVTIYILAVLPFKKYTWKGRQFKS